MAAVDSSCKSLQKFSASLRTLEGILSVSLFRDCRSCCSTYSRSSTSCSSLLLLPSVSAAWRSSHSTSPCLRNSYCLTMSIIIILTICICCMKEWLLNFALWRKELPLYFMCIIIVTIRVFPEFLVNWVQCSFWRGSEAVWQGRIR